METLLKLAQPTASVSRRAVVSAFIFLLVSAIQADLQEAIPGLIQSADASERVFVLTAGGISDLKRVTVRSNLETPTISSSSPLSLQLWEGPAATYTDIVVLPGGDIVLADGSGRGAVFFDSQGQQVDELFGAGGMSAPSSVVAGAYLGPNDPELLVMGDNTVGRVHLYDLIDRRYSWSYSLIHETVRGDVERAIQLPEQRVALAAVWPGLSLSAIKIVTTDSPADEVLALYSRPVSDAPDAPVIEDLHPVRDIMADLDGRLLITSQTQLAIVDSAGELLWKVSLGDDPAFGGEFQSARWLDSGLIVAATRQPGQWNSPHLNHRVHLIDPQAEAPLLDSSPSLDRAPLRLEVEAGHGGTGTREYFADAYDFVLPDVESLHLDDGPSLSPTDIARDENAFFEFTLTYTGEGIISLRRTEFRIHQGSCSELNLPADLSYPWWSTTNQDLGNQESWTEERLLFPDEFALGDWCGQLAITLRNGTRHFLGSPIDFEVLAPAGGEQRPVQVDDLAEFGSDAGYGADVGSGSGDDESAGCGCSSTNRPPGGALILLIALGVWRVRRHCPR